MRFLRVDERSEDSCKVRDVFSRVDGRSSDSYVSRHFFLQEKS